MSAVDLTALDGTPTASDNSPAPVAATGVSEHVGTRTRTRTRERQLSGSVESPQLPSDAKKKSDAELFGLLAEYDAGELAPEDAALGALPLDASDDMRRVAADMRLLIGLRLAVGEDRPLPYSARLAAERMGWKDPRRASRAIKRLCRAGVIDYAGSLPARGQPFGTKTYAPPLPISTNTIEDESIAVERLDRPAIEPAGVVEDEASVADTEPAAIRPIAASENRAERATVHKAHVTPPVGGWERPA
jgi:hypothetical protein